MKRFLKFTAMVRCFCFIIMLFSFSTNIGITRANATPLSEDFNLVTAENEYQPSPQTYGNWTFSTFNLAGVNDSGGSVWVNDQSRRQYFTGGNSNVLVCSAADYALSVKSDSGTFKLNSFSMQNIASFQPKFNLIGYRDGTFIVSQGITDATGPTTVRVSGREWENIDEFRIFNLNLFNIEQADLAFAIDDIDVSAPIIRPTLVSATRTDNTHITVALNKDCTNIAKANEGGFTVSETNAPSTEYAVSSIAQGVDASHIVLTVADMAISAKQGVEVTYTNGTNGTNGTNATNGTISDTETTPNLMATDRTGVAVAAWDRVAPTISSATLAADNSYIDINLSEGSYGAPDSTTAITSGNLAMTFSQNGGTATNAVINSIKKNDNILEGSASALTGGESLVRVFITLTGTPSGTETIKITPADNASIYDKAVNAMLTTQNTGLKTLNAVPAPTMSIKGNAISISDGDATPSTLDNTDFGDANISGETVTKTFIIENTGTAELTLSGTPIATISGADAADFTVKVQPSRTVASVVGTTTFDVVFDPSATGSKTATINIANNDSGKNSYNFNIQGTGITAPPSITSQPIDQVVNAGHTASFSVSATGIGPLFYQWKYNGVAIPGAITSTYTINTAQIADEGDYTVMVTNVMGTATSDIATLTIDEDQITTTTPSAVIIKGTERVNKTLEAQLVSNNGTIVTTSSGVTYEWYRLSSKNSANGTLIGDNKTYKLVGRDQGDYIKLIATYDGKTFEDTTGVISKKSHSSSSSSSSNNSNSNSSGTSTNTNANTNTNTPENNNGSNNGSDSRVTGWEKRSDSTWVYIRDGQNITNWNQIKGYWYLMDSSGIMKTGWQQSNNYWYYLGDDGSMLTGWRNVNGKWYYLYSNGAMASDTIIEGYRVNKDGAWFK